MKERPDTPILRIIQIAKSVLIYLREVVRPGRLELLTFWFVGTQYKTLSAASGVAYRGTRHLSRSWVGPKLDWNRWGEPL